MSSGRGTVNLVVEAIMSSSPKKHRHSTAAVKHKITSYPPSPCSDNPLNNPGLSSIYSFDFIRKGRKTKGKTRSTISKPLKQPLFLLNPSEPITLFLIVCSFYHVPFFPLWLLQSLNLTCSCYSGTIPDLSIILPTLQKLPICLYTLTKQQS